MTAAAPARSGRITKSVTRSVRVLTLLIQTGFAAGMVESEGWGAARGAALSEFVTDRPANGTGTGHNGGYAKLRRGTMPSMPTPSYRQYQYRSRRDARRAAGVCLECESPAPADALRCPTCAARVNAASVRWRHRNDPPQGCATQGCDAPVDYAGRICAECGQAAAERAGAVYCPALGMGCWACAAAADCAIAPGVAVTAPQDDETVIPAYAGMTVSVETPPP